MAGKKGMHKARLARLAAMNGRSQNLPTAVQVPVPVPQVVPVPVTVQTPAPTQTLPTDFKVIEEQPLHRQGGRREVINWQARLDQIQFPNRWYCIGIWDNVTSASGAMKKLKEKFTGYSFVTNAIKEEKKSKLYAMKIC